MNIDHHSRYIERRKSERQKDKKETTRLTPIDIPPPGQQ